MYCERARRESSRVVLVVEVGCVDRVSPRFYGNKGWNAPLIIYHPGMNSRLDFVDILVDDLELETD